MELAILNKFSKYKNWVSLVGSLIMVRIEDFSARIIRFSIEACQLQRCFKEFQKDFSKVSGELQINPKGFRVLQCGFKCFRGLYGVSGCISFLVVLRKLLDVRKALGPNFRRWGGVEKCENVFSVLNSEKQT